MCVLERERRALLLLLRRPVRGEVRCGAAEGEGHDDGGEAARSIRVAVCLSGKKHKGVDVSNLISH